jgi:hypothetical protein
MMLIFKSMPSSACQGKVKKGWKGNIKLQQHADGQTESPILHLEPKKHVLQHFLTHINNATENKNSVTSLKYL